MLLVTGAVKETPAASLFQSVGGLTVAVCILLAFFPPRAYVERIARRAGRQES